MNHQKILKNEKILQVVVKLEDKLDTKKNE